MLPGNGDNRACLGLLKAVSGLLFVRELDLQAFRVLLLLTIGCTPEELHDVPLADVEFTDGGVRVTYQKLRANRIRARLHHADPATSDGPAEHVYDGAGAWGTPGLLRRLLAATQPVRESFAVDGWLFVAVEPSTDRGHVVLRGARALFADIRGFSAWVASHVTADRGPGLVLSAPVEVRRIRKTVKTARVVALGGAVSDLAGDDHYVEVFRGHYAHGSAAHVLSGRAINRAQEKVFGRILDRPLLIDAAAERRLAEPAVAEAVGMTVAQAVSMRAGELDMGITNCRNPYDSPYTPDGGLCHVAPTMCMLCRNAMVFVSHLPRLLLLAEHIERMRAVLDPPRWHSVWGVQAAALTELFATCEDQLPAARRRIAEDNVRLDLPLGMKTEYDR